MKKKLFATVLLVLLGVLSYAGEGVGPKPSLAVQKWHAFHGTLPFWEVIKSPPTGAGGVTVGGTNVFTGSNTFLDTGFKVCDDVDQTKCINYGQLSGITTGNTLSPITYTSSAASPRMSTLGELVVWGSWNVNSNGDWVGLNTAKLGFSGSGSVTFGAVADSFFTRDGAAASIQQGVDLNGAAIAQSLKACDGITGTDVAGCDYTLAGGRGTGIGAPGDVKVQTAKDLATGTTAQTLFVRHFYRGKAFALTESAATTFITFNIPTTLTAVGGEVRYCIHATDGTDVQERCGDADFTCVNKAGTVTPSAVNLLGTEATALTAGTLTNTMTLVNSGTTCSMQANAVSSLTQTILDIRYSVELQGSGTVTP